MIKKNRGNFQWLEFELLQEQGVEHGVYLKNQIKIVPQNTIYFHQVHGKEVAHIGEEKLGLKVDAAITNKKRIPLAIKHADCQAAIFFDPVTKSLAVVHAGWRGLVQNIYKETLLKLCSTFHVKKENVIVCIGPSLEPEHSEFIHYKDEFPQTFWDFQVKPNYFNLWEIARFQLRELGIKPKNIEIAGIGTYGNHEEFYSYRRAKDGLRNITVAALI